MATQQTNRAINLLSSMVTAYSEKQYADDPRYLDEWRWVNGDVSCWRCNLGPSVAASFVPDAKYTAFKTFEQAIADHRKLDGGFGAVGDTVSNPIETMFFANQLGLAMMGLRKHQWVTQLCNAADFLIMSGTLQWYANGNIALGNALTMAHAWRVSGAPRFKDAYRSALSFAKAPSQDKWPGFGLILTTQPTKIDCSDGAGYLAEQDPDKRPGLDLDYLQLQADFATQLYLVHPTLESLRLMNLFLNLLLEHTDTQTWKLDISNGTRHPEPGQWRYLNVSTLAVLGQLGKRPDLAKLVSSQWSSLETDFLSARAYTNGGMYYNLGSQPTAIALAMRMSQEANYSAT